MTDFWQSETYRIVQAMKATGNQPGIVGLWKVTIELWANEAPLDADRAAVLAWLPHWQVRPFYTAAELAPIFPPLAIMLGISTRLTPIKGANRLANELIFAGLPILGTYYTHTTVPQRFFIVERCHYWRDRTLTQADFEKEFFDASHG